MRVRKGERLSANFGYFPSPESNPSESVPFRRRYAVVERATTGRPYDGGRGWPHPPEGYSYKPSINLLMRNMPSRMFSSDVA